jgi:hypothetical protein
MIDIVWEYQLVTYRFPFSGLNVIPVAPELPVGTVFMMLFVESSIAETKLVELGSEL